LNNYILPDIYIEKGLQEKRKNLESFSTLFLSFELKEEDIEESRKFIYLESVSEMIHYSCLQKDTFLTQVIHIYFENGGKHLYLMPQTEEKEILFDNSKYISFLAKHLDFLIDIETVVAIDVFLTDKFILSDARIQNIQNSISTYCKSTNRLSLMDLPFNKNPINHALELYYTMSFYPWIIDKNNNLLPPSIYASALLSKLSSENKLFNSIANIELENVIDTNILIDRDEATELYKNSINPIVYIQNDGYKIWGVRTLGDNIETINVLRVFFFIKRRLLSIGKEYIFEPNNRTLEEKIIRKVRKFLLNLWNIGVLKGNSKEEAFELRLEKLENQLIFKITVSIVKPLEYMVIYLNRTSNDNLETTLNIL
jgi:hypothetical protein